MTEYQKQAYLNLCADGFDTYISDGRMPPEVTGHSLLGQYVRDVADRNLNLGGADPEYREAFKENLKSFLGEMLDKFSNIDRGAEQEKMLQNRFMKGTTAERRSMWKRVKEFAKAQYSPLDLNADGFDSQLREDNQEQIFDLYARDWQDASERRLRQTKQNLMHIEASQWERQNQSRCHQDYLRRKRINQSLKRYPQLEHIAKIIGRCRDTPTQDTTRFASRYKPTSLSPTPSFEEIDRITEGNSLERVIPSEFSYLAERDTEILFMARYARRQLQQFSAPGTNPAVKDTQATPSPRPAYGPIIASVDTSGSMTGLPLEIAFAMLHRLLDIARRENRPCCLITYSVRSRVIDLSEPGAWRNLESFLQSSYTGGTNGESMLREAVNRLRRDNFRMADVLIISDFAFAPPIPETLGAIRREQALDTRFYGLQIGKINTPYSQILDKIWIID